MRHSEQPDNVIDVLKSYAGHSDPIIPQQRDIGVGAQILRELGVRKMKLLSNHDIQG
jgi:GTP cyclohydrolase II